MYPNDTPNISDGTSNHVYSLVNLGAGPGVESVRRESAAPADQPAKLTIKHSTSGTGDATVNSSLLRFDRVVERADGVQGFDTTYVVKRFTPKVVDNAQAIKGLNEVVSFLGIAGYKDKFVAGEP